VNVSPKGTQPKTGNLVSFSSGLSFRLIYIIQYVRIWSNVDNFILAQAEGGSFAYMGKAAEKNAGEELFEVFPFISNLSYKAAQLHSPILSAIVFSPAFSYSFLPKLLEGKDKVRQVGLSFPGLQYQI